MRQTNAHNARHRESEIKMIIMGMLMVIIESSSQNSYYLHCLSQCAFCTNHSLTLSLLLHFALSFSMSDRHLRTGT